MCTLLARRLAGEKRILCAAAVGLIIALNAM
jgi:hypothetical protein